MNKMAKLSNNLVNLPKFTYFKKGGHFKIVNTICRMFWVMVRVVFPELRVWSVRALKSLLLSLLETINVKLTLVS